MCIIKLNLIKQLNKIHARSETTTTTQQKREIKCW